MPDTITKDTLLSALQTAEGNIVSFVPPSVVTNPTDPNLVDLRQELATKSAGERANALFDVFVSLITQEAGKEIDRRQLEQSLNDLKTTVTGLTTRVQTLEAQLGISSVSS